MPHRASEPRALTERQEIFCRHVARGASGAAAARAAGYAPGNAAQQGSHLLQQGPVRLRIEALRMRREANRSGAVCELVDVLRLLMRRAIKASDHRAAIRCIEVEARLCGLFPDRAAHDFAGADPLLDMTDGRPAGMILDRLFDEEEEDPTPINPEETPAFPMEFSLQNTTPSTGPSTPVSPGEDPAPSSGRPPRAEAAVAAVHAGEGDHLSSTGNRPGMDAGSGPARQSEGAELPPNGFIEPADHDAFEVDPEPDPVEARRRRVAAQQAAEDARYAAECPPRATSPTAPREARSPVPNVRAVFANRYGWDNAWADTPWTPPDWLAHVEVRDSRRTADCAR